MSMWQGGLLGFEQLLDQLEADIKDYLHPFVHGNESTTVILGGKKTESLRSLVSKMKLAIGHVTGEIPGYVFDSKSELAASLVNAEIHTVNVRGDEVASDGRGGLFVDGDTGSSDKVVSADGRTWYRVEAGIDRRVLEYKIRQSIGYVIGKMHSNQPVSIACYGDSTTDGNGTTGWKRHTEAGGGVGMIDHRDTAPNAWPAKLEPILREMYDNENIRVWNAGYSGTRLDTGWAVANYDQAVINNPYYGVPDICIIAFGINDAGAAGSQLEPYMLQMQLLIAKIIKLGSVPIIMSPDATRYIAAVEAESREARMFEISRSLIPAMKEAANWWGIPFFDMHRALLDWFGRNDDSRHWKDVQADSVHVGDVGHSFKAGYIASRLFSDALNIRDGSLDRVCVGDTRGLIDPPGYVAISNYHSMRTEQNYTLHGSVAYTPGNEYVRMWVWNEEPDATLVYRSFANENIAAWENAPQIKIKDMISQEVIYEKPTPSSGMAVVATVQHVDRPNIIYKLPYGLSKVSMLAPPVTGLTWYPGYFEVNSKCETGFRPASHFKRDKTTNLLKQTGPLFYQGPADIGLKSMRRSEEAADLSNVIFVPVGGKAVVYVDADISYGTGFSLMGGKRWMGGGVDTTGNSSTHLIVYFNTGYSGFYLVNTDQYGVVGDMLGSLESAFAAVDATTLSRVRVELSRGDNGSIAYSFYTDWLNNSPPLFTVNINNAIREVPSAGYFGDLFAWQSNYGPGNGSIYIKQAFVEYKYD